MRPSLAIAAVLLSLSLHAYAEPDKNAANAEAASAQKLYEDSQYHDAAGHFARAYELDPQAAYLFDAAQAYRFAKECASSAKFYRQFLEVAKQQQAQNLDKVKHYIAEMDQCAKPPATKPPEPPPDTGHTEPAHAEPAEPPHQPPPPPIVDTSPADPGSTQRKIGLGLGAVGAAALVTGVVFTFKVRGDEISCSPAHTCTQGEIDNANKNGPSDERYEKIFYAVGGVALAGGIALYLLGKSHVGEHAVVIAPTPGGAMAAFTF
jgi:tetratricopeptide (TPR) repeat protein